MKVVESCSRNRWTEHSSIIGSNTKETKCKRKCTCSVPRFSNHAGIHLFRVKSELEKRSSSSLALDYGREHAFDGLMCFLRRRKKYLHGNSSSKRHERAVQYYSKGTMIRFETRPILNGIIMHGTPALIKDITPAVHGRRPFSSPGT